jgi:GTP pyrophosphokinase
MKVQRLRVPIEDILDLVAVRIIISNARTTRSAQDTTALPFAGDAHNTMDETMCYEIMDIVHRCWIPLPKAYKDYISNPKPNGYRSLHTTVIVGKQPVEIQIRTEQMHFHAEFGAAAHALYKKDQNIHTNPHQLTEPIREIAPEHTIHT